MELLAGCEHQVALATAADFGLQEPWQNIFFRDLQRQVNRVFGPKFWSHLVAALTMFPGLGGKDMDFHLPAPPATLHSL